MDRPNYVLWNLCVNFTSWLIPNFDSYSPARTYYSAKGFTHMPLSILRSNWFRQSVKLDVTAETMKTIRRINNNILSHVFVTIVIFLLFFLLSVVSCCLFSGCYVIDCKSTSRYHYSLLFAFFSLFFFLQEFSNK